MCTFQAPWASSLGCQRYTTCKCSVSLFSLHKKVTIQTEVFVFLHLIWSLCKKQRFLQILKLTLSTISSHDKIRTSLVFFVASFILVKIARTQLHIQETSPSSLFVVAFRKGFQSLDLAVWLGSAGKCGKGGGAHMSRCELPFPTFYLFSIH